MLLAASLLAALVVEVTAHGAVAGDDASDSTAFRAAIAAAVSGDTIHAGCGTWDLPRINSTTAVLIDARSNLTIDGDGECTVFRMAGGTHTGDYNVFYTRYSDHITFKDFYLDGNRSNIVSADEQTHGMVVMDSTYVTIHDVDFAHLYGDGVKLIANSRALQHDITVHDVTIDDTGRGGLGFFGSANVLVYNYTATNISDQGIDMEPSGVDGLLDVVIRDSYIGAPTQKGATALSLSGAAGQTETSNVRIEDTTIMGGIHGVRANNVTLYRVKIVAEYTPAIDFSRNYDNVIIYDCSISSYGDHNAIHASFVGGDGPSDWLILDTRITTWKGVALDFEAFDGPLTVSGLHVNTHIPSTGNGTAILLSNTQASPNFARVIIDDIHIESVKLGVVLSRNISSANINDVTIRGDITLTRSDSIGVTCVNDTGSDIAFTDNLTITANTRTSGCL